MITSLGLASFGRDRSESTSLSRSSVNARGSSAGCSCVNFCSSSIDADDFIALSALSNQDYTSTLHQEGREVYPEFLDCFDNFRAVDGEGLNKFFECKDRCVCDEIDRV